MLKGLKCLGHGSYRCRQYGDDIQCGSIWIQKSILMAQTQITDIAQLLTATHTVPARLPCRAYRKNAAVDGSANPVTPTSIDAPSAPSTTLCSRQVRVHGLQANSQGCSHRAHSSRFWSLPNPQFHANLGYHDAVPKESRRGDTLSSSCLPCAIPCVLTGLPFFQAQAEAHP